jgi:mannose-6-phosphate isomerase-like protein (cupin superfamily)
MRKSACATTTIPFVMVLLVMLSGSGGAQQPPAPNRPAPDLTQAIYMSAPDAAAAVAATAAKQGTSPNGVTRVFQLLPYTVQIEHRNPVAQAAAVHDKDAELFYVIDGSATLVTGGKLVDPMRNGDNLTGTAIEGGTSQRMSKGDFMLIPQGVPHWITSIQGSFTPMTLHLPMMK